MQKSGFYKSKKVKGVSKNRLRSDFADDGLYIPVGTVEGYEELEGFWLVGWLF